MEIFFSTFPSLFRSVLMIFLIAGVAGILVRKGILNDHVVKSLSQVTVQILLPCLIFSSVAGNLDISTFPIWWVVPLLSIGIVGIGIGLSSLLFLKDLPAKRNLIPLSAMMNAGYFILPIGKVIFPEHFAEFALYVSLFILGINPILWSLGKYYMTTETGQKTQWRQLITPPLTANLLAIFLVLTRLNRLLPEVVMNSVDMLGSATVAIATLILGASFGRLTLNLGIPVWDVVRVNLVKLIAVPGITLIILLFSPLRGNYPILSDLIILEATAPAATALIIQVRRYGGDEKTAGGIMFISYILSLLFVPFWLALWRSLA